jgi:hypothetical protein
MQSDTACTSPTYHDVSVWVAVVPMHVGVPIGSLSDVQVHEETTEPIFLALVFVRLEVAKIWSHVLPRNVDAGVESEAMLKNRLLAEVFENLMRRDSHIRHHLMDSRSGKYARLQRPTTRTTPGKVRKVQAKPCYFRRWARKEQPVTVLLRA